MNYVIIGNSAAGINAAEEIRRWDRDSSLVIISEENYPAYCRCLIPELISGKKTFNEILYREEGFYETIGIKTLLGKKVERVLPWEKKLILSSAEEIGYDLLLIAAGASPIRLKKEDKRPLAFTLRTVEDALRIREEAKEMGRAVVIGASLIGLKTAQALKDLGLCVSLLEKSSHILPGLVDTQGAGILEDLFKEKGIEIQLNSEVGGLIEKGLKLSDGRVIETRMVVMTMGVRPNIDFIQGTDIKTRSGILTNAQMQTNIPEIFAAGDIVEYENLLEPEMEMVNAIWPRATLQGKVAGAIMAGKMRTYEGTLVMNSVDFYGIPLISAGLVSPGKRDYQENILKFSPQKQIYQKLVFTGDRLAGLLLIGSIEKAGVVINLLSQRKEISSFKDRLLSGEFRYGKLFPLEVPTLL